MNNNSQEIVLLLKELIEEVKYASEKNSQAVSETAREKKSVEDSSGAGEMGDESKVEKILKEAWERLGKDVDAKQEKMLDGIKNIFVDGLDALIKSAQAQFNQGFNDEQRAANVVAERAAQLARHGITMSKEEQAAMNNVALRMFQRETNARQDVMNYIDPQVPLGQGYFLDQGRRFLVNQLDKGVDSVAGYDVDTQYELNKAWTNSLRKGYEMSPGTQINRDRLEQSEEDFYRQSRANAERQAKIHSNHKTNSTWGN